MKQEEIFDNNKIIAKFMGYGYKQYGGWGYHYYNQETGDIWKNDAQLKYHSSWDWLMPVVEKIESVDFIVSMRQSSITICNNICKTPYFQSHEVSNTKIESTYKAVIAFVKWYNTQ
jgi:hypothetical protein